MLFGNKRSQFERRGTVPGRLATLLVAGCGLLGPVTGAVQGMSAPAAIPGTAAGELIPYTRFTLGNGLTVVVHTDRKAPIVAVNVWYHVGSKNEVPGKTGFAHLFEHLMFQGSEHYDDEYFKPFEQVGATSMNGTTSFDRTNYFQNVPTTALDLALWMESDRMGHLLGVVTQPRLDEQRGVVKNEKRQGENRPYGRVPETVYRASFPPGHPYRTLPIGSMADLDAATLDDVREWFRTYYGAANAVLVLAGDIDVPTARAKAEQYFGHIAPGPALTRPGTWIAARSDSRRETMYDQVAQPRWQRYWNTPPDNTRDSEYLGLVGEILGGGKTSRLYERLVYRERLADSAGCRPVAARNRRTLHAVRRRQAGRSRRARRGGDDGGTAALHRKGADQCRARAGQDRNSRGFRPRPGTHRRLRRQGGRARLVRGVCGRSGLLSPVTAVDRRRTARRSAARRAPVAVAG